MVDIIRVSSGSRTRSVAGAIAEVVRGQGRVGVQALGAGAVNQAVKAVAIARVYLHSDGIEVVCIPMFVDVTVGDDQRTALRLIVERAGGPPYDEGDAVFQGPAPA